MRLVKSALAVKAGGKREDIATWEEKGTRDMVYRGLPGALSRVLKQLVIGRI